MKNKYAVAEYRENMARALAKDMAVSTKTAIEMSKFLKGRSTEKAKAILGRILEKKQALPFTRYTNGLGHRKGAGIAAGRYPQVASQAFLDLIESVEKNAQTKGLSSDLVIKHLIANKGPKAWHYGRQRRRQQKRTHIEIIVEEQEKKQENAPKRKKETKQAGKEQ